MNRYVGPPSGPGDPSLTVRIVDLVAEVDGVDPVALPALYDAIDPESLGGLIARATPGTYVHFEYHGYAIRVHGDGEVELVGRDGPGDGT